MNSLYTSKHLSNLSKVLEREIFNKKWKTIEIVHCKLHLKPNLGKKSYEHYRNFKDDLYNRFCALRGRQRRIISIL